MNFLNRQKWHILLALILLIAIGFITLYPTLQNSWINWGDDVYVLENLLIRDSSYNGLLQLFVPTNKTLDTYTPLTLVSFAWEYSAVGLEPFLYHLDNLILHLLNVVLVFFIIKKLSDNLRVAFFVALLFGIHPMHVESVAWLSERKDTLYGFFFLLSILIYQYHLDKAKTGFFHGLKDPLYWFTVASFALSMLANPQAVCLPFVLLLFYWHKHEKLNLKSVLSILPFMAIALFFSLIALNEIPPSVGNHNLWDRALLSSYATLLYIQKLFVPWPISVHYPFTVGDNGSYPIRVYLSFFLLLVAGVFILFRLKKNKKLFFGSAFFLIALAPGLHFIQVNSAIISDRFTYISYIGLFFAIAIWLDRWFENRKVIIGSICLLVFGALAFISHNRCYAWKDSETLWESTLRVYPNSHMAYGMRAKLWAEKGKMEDALQDYITCAEIKPYFTECLNNAGLLLMQKGDYITAMSYLDRAIKTDSTYWRAYLNRAIVCDNLRLYNRAIDDADQTLCLKPDEPMARMLRATVSEKTGKLEAALADYNLLLSQDPNNAVLYTRRGLVAFKIGDVKQGLNDYNRAIKLNPNYAEAYYRRSRLYFYREQIDSALTDVLKAQALGFEVRESYLQQLREK